MSNLEYDIVCEDGSVIIMIEKIQNRINEGWELSGALIVASTDDSIMFYQPMLRIKAIREILAPILAERK